MRLKTLGISDSSTRGRTSSSTAIAVLDEVRERVPQERMGTVFGRISFFVNAGVRFVEEHAKLRAMSALWDEIGRE
ncbi:MAG TPA: methylmalonyl-CoA mutase family protein, partial [Solirubrobacteraceae bacterium]|nr:methylmalonyl-CoA mutase family protein [Solirubrobacteraceae bacterium]